MLSVPVHFLPCEQDTGNAGFTAWDCAQQRSQLSPGKNPINSRKMQRRKVREETRASPGGVRTVVQSLLRLRGALLSLGTPAKNKQPRAELTQPHPG